MFKVDKMLNGQLLDFSLY